MNTERIKERNEIAKAIYLKNTILTESVAYNAVVVYNAVQAANDMMAQMYGSDWAGESDEQPSQPAPSGMTTPIVSIAELNGEKGVRLCVGEVDIFIEAHSLDGGKEFDGCKEFKWEKAMERLKEVGKQTFNKHKMYLIAAYVDEINDKMREIGGEKLEGRYWSSTGNGLYSAWLANFNSEDIYSLDKSTSCLVRPCANLKHS